MYTSFLRSSFHKQLKWLWSQWMHLQDILAPWGLPGRAGRDIFMEAYSPIAHLQRQWSPRGTKVFLDFCLSQRFCCFWILGICHMGSQYCNCPTWCSAWGQRGVQPRTCAFLPLLSFALMLPHQTLACSLLTMPGSAGWAQVLPSTSHTPFCFILPRTNLASLAAHWATPVNSSLRNQMPPE